MREFERNDIIFGTAYYPEYMPYERLQEDIVMMQEAGMNTVRIAESTWSTLEPVEGTFDFSYIDKVLTAVEKAGIHNHSEALSLTCSVHTEVFRLSVHRTG